MSQGHEMDDFQHRHLAIVWVDTKLMLQLFHPSLPNIWYRTDEGLPEDAKFISAGYDALRMSYWFMWEHDSLPAIPEGQGYEVTATIRPIQESLYLDKRLIPEIERLMAMSG